MRPLSRLQRFHGAEGLVRLAGLVHPTATPSRQCSTTATPPGMAGEGIGAVHNANDSAAAPTSSNSSASATTANSSVTGQIQSMLIFLCDSSGSKKGPDYLFSHVEPFLFRQGFVFKLSRISLEDPVHFLNKENPSEWESFCVVGGGGTVDLVLNRMALSQEAEQWLTKPILVIPAGRKNNVATSLGIRSMEDIDYCLETQQTTAVPVWDVTIGVDWRIYSKDELDVDPAEAEADEERKNATNSTDKSGSATESNSSALKSTATSFLSAMSGRMKIGTRDGGASSDERTSAILHRRQERHYGSLTVESAGFGYVSNVLNTVDYIRARNKEYTALPWLFKPFFWSSVLTSVMHSPLLAKVKSIQPDGTVRQDERPRLYDSVFATQLPCVHGGLPWYPEKDISSGVMNMHAATTTGRYQLYQLMCGSGNGVSDWVASRSGRFEGAMGAVPGDIGNQLLDDEARSQGGKVLPYDPSETASVEPVIAVEAKIWGLNAVSLGSETLEVPKRKAVRVGLGEDGFVDQEWFDEVEKRRYSTFRLVRTPLRVKFFTARDKPPQDE